MTRVAGSLAKSGEVLKLVNNLMKVPQLQRTMMEMSRGELGGRAGGRAGGQAPVGLQHTRLAAQAGAAAWRQGAGGGVHLLACPSPALPCWFAVLECTPWHCPACSVVP